MMNTRGTGELNAMLQQFEGLVFTTARMWAAQVKREEEDLAQELRVRVWRACVTWTPSKGATRNAYVYMAVANKIKDFKRDAAREKQRRQENGLSFAYIEDMKLLDGTTVTAQERFDALYHHLTHDQAYADVERDAFTLPAAVTGRESQVLVLLVYGFTRGEIAHRLRQDTATVNGDIRALREKLADWKPSGSLVQLGVATAALALAA